MEESEKPIIIDTDALGSQINNADFYSDPSRVHDIYEKRKQLADDLHRVLPVDVTIIVIAFNRKEKTKRCVESILKYTKDIPYELYLIDNGSDDGTLEYFNSVLYENKIILRFTKNNPYVLNYIDVMDLGKYVVGLANDAIVTPGWLHNLIICAESDPRIGLVQPVSSNVSNLQDPGITYSSYENMQKKAALFNHSDPKKWEERLRIITLGYLVKKEVLLGFRWPLQDMAFSYFADDDLAFMIRRMGYKIILAGDTWICHDHRQNGIQADTLEENRNKFKQKHHGIDAWDDVNNFWKPYLSGLMPINIKKPVKILGIDVKCGTPILDIKNWLRSKGIFETETSAITENAMYYHDLLTCCDENVIVDQIDSLKVHFGENEFDYIILDNPINSYTDISKRLEDMISLCRVGGTVFLRLKNTFSFHEFLHVSYMQILDREKFYMSISFDELKKSIRGANLDVLYAVTYPLDDDSDSKLRDIIKLLKTRKEIENYSVNLLKTDCWVMQLTKTDTV